MRIAIVEDHAAERQLMAVMCAEYFKRTRDIGVECVTFADAESFIESWKDARYDLLLLDCYLSDDETATHAATGLDIARTLRRQNDDCPIVFITSSTDFAVLGYEVQASGYLLKPQRPGRQSPKRKQQRQRRLRQRNRQQRSYQRSPVQMQCRLR